MDNVKYLVGTENICNRPLEPYSQEICDFAATLSDVL